MEVMVWMFWGALGGILALICAVIGVYLGCWATYAVCWIGMTIWRSVWSGHERPKLRDWT